MDTLKEVSDFLKRDAELQTMKNEIERLRGALRLIADHPVAKTNKWETGAKEMQALAVRTLEVKK
jgi:hypothetical protein